VVERVSLIDAGIWVRERRSRRACARAGRRHDAGTATGRRRLAAGACLARRAMGAAAGYWWWVEQGRWPSYRSWPGYAEIRVEGSDAESLRECPDRHGSGKAPL